MSNQHTTIISRFALTAMVAVVLLSDSNPADAQRRRFPGRSDSLLELAEDREIRDELKLTDEQLEKVDMIQDKYRGAREKGREFFERMRNAKDDAERQKVETEMRAFFESQRSMAEADLAKVVSADQLRGLRIHQLKRRGVRGLGAEWVVAELKLTDDQKKKLETLSQGHEQQRRALNTARRALFEDQDLTREQRDEKQKAFQAQEEQLGQQRDQAVLGVLTAEQKTSFQALTGAPASSDGKPVAAQPAPATPTPAKPATPKPSATPIAPSSGPAVVGSDGKPDSGKVVVSFGEGVSPDSTKPSKSLTFNFVQAPWVDVLNLFAGAAGLTWDRETVPPGTFTYRDDQEYTPTEALNVLNGALLQKGFILVRRDRFAVVVSVDNPVPPNLVPTVAIADLPKRASHELVRVVLPLKGKDANKAADEVGEMLGPQGKAVPISVANSLVLIGLTKNLVEIHTVLEAYVVEEKKDVAYEAFVLEHVSALSAEKMVRDLFGLQPRGVQNVSAASGADNSRSRSSRGGGFDPRSRFGGSSRSSRGGSDPRQQQRGGGGASSNGAVSVTVDERTNMLLAMAPPAQMEVIRKAVETIDVASQGPNRFASETQDNEPYLEVYKVTSADTLEVTKTLNVLFPGAVVNEDGRFRTIHVMATSSEHKEVGRMINKLDGQGGTQTTAIIPIRQDPVSLTATLQGLYAKDINSAPSVIANPGYLVVRGNTDQIAEIKQMVTQLESALGASLATGGGPIRSIPLGGRDANSLLRMLQSVTPNPIRISTPSAGRGPIGEQRVPSADDPRVRPAPRGDAAAGGGGAAARNPDRANFSIPPTRQAEADRGTGAAATDQDRGRDSETEPTPEQRYRRLATFVFNNLDKDKDGQLNDEEWTASQRTRTLFDSKKIMLKLPVKKDTFIKAFVSLVEAENSPKAETPAATPAPATNRGAANNVPAGGAGREPAAADPARREARGERQDGQERLPEIVIEIRDGNLVLMSEDEAALDQLESRLQSLMQHMSPKTTWTIFYLRSADATEASLMLERLFPQSSVSATASSSGGSLLGDLTGGFSSLGSSLMDMTGINSLQSGPMALRIIPETRANALFVSGPADQVADVESVLKILDAAELPEQLRQRAPRYITVEHADVNEVAQIVRDVYKEELSSGGGRSSGGNPMQGMNPLAMLMGGGGSSRGRSSRNSGNSRKAGVRMTLGVDARTSALVVSASDSLFKQVESLVQTLDDAAKEAKRTVRIVTLENTNSSAIQQAVSALLPKASVSTGGGSNGPTGFGPQSRGSSRSSSRGSSQGGDQAARMRQFMEMRQRMMRGSGGSSSRGGSPFGGFTRGGSSRGGSSRGGSPFGGGGSRFGGSRGR